MKSFEERSEKSNQVFWCFARLFLVIILKKSLKDRQNHWMIYETKWKSTKIHDAVLYTYLGT